MARLWVDLTAVRHGLDTFLQVRSRDLNRFGSTVNQVFETFVFTEVLRWYQQRKWRVVLHHPGGKSQTLGGRNPTAAAGHLRLKFSTRGRPSAYTFARCHLGDDVVQVRHQLRVDTRAYRRRRNLDLKHRPPVKGKRRAPKVPLPDKWANVCLDVAVIDDINLDQYESDWSVPNAVLQTFGEAKHMSAFAELVAGFLGLVLELQPRRLKRIRTAKFAGGPHPAPFLHVSGHLFRTAEGIVDTIARRRFDVDIYSRTRTLAGGAVPTKAPPSPRSGRRS